MRNFKIEEKRDIKIPNYTPLNALQPLETIHKGKKTKIKKTSCMQSANTCNKVRQK